MAELTQLQKIGLRAKTRMLELNITANELGFKNKIEPSIIRKIAKGEQGYNISSLLKVCELLNLEIAIFPTEIKQIKNPN